MKQINDKISLVELKAMSERMYGSIVKAAVGVVKGMLIVNMDMYADGEAALLDNG